MEENGVPNFDFDKVLAEQKERIKQLEKIVCGTSDNLKSDGAIVPRGCAPSKQKGTFNESLQSNSAAESYEHAECSTPNLFYNWDKDIAVGVRCNFNDCEPCVENKKKNLEWRIERVYDKIKKPFRIITLESNDPFLDKNDEIVTPALRRLKRRLQYRGKMKMNVWVKQIVVERKLPRFILHILTFDFIEESLIRKFWNIGKITIGKFRNHSPSCISKYYTETKYQYLHPKYDRRCGYSRHFSKAVLEPKPMKTEEEEKIDELAPKEKDTWTFHFWRTAPNFVKDAYYRECETIINPGKNNDSSGSGEFEGVYYKQYEKFWH